MKKKTVLVWVLAVTLLLGGCIQPDPSHPLGTAAPSVTAPPLPAEPPVDHFYQDAVYVYQTDVDESLLTTELNLDYLILANKVYVLGADHVPANLTRLDASVVIEWQEKIKGLYLERTAALALYEMIDEMKHAGVTDVWVTSAYRDYAYQRDTFNKYCYEEQQTISDNAAAYFGDQYLETHYFSQGKYKLSAADAERVVLSYSAAPGTSEHQTGLCVDLTTESLWGGLNTDFENTPAFAWLAQNAYKFGFILRYPNGKEGITGYTYEPWHYRFVGREAATDIHFAGLTLEEYRGAVKS